MKRRLCAEELGVSTVILEIRRRLLRAEAIVMDEIIESIDVFVGIDVMESARRRYHQWKWRRGVQNGALCSKYATNSNDLQEQWDKSVQSQRQRFQCEIWWWEMHCWVELDYRAPVIKELGWLLWNSPEGRGEDRVWQRSNAGSRRESLPYETKMWGWECYH